MLDPYAFESLLKMEQKLLSDRHARQAVWIERMPRRTSGSALVAARRRLARLLLTLADRLDPRTVVSVPHMPSSPALNGTLHHA